MSSLDKVVIEGGASSEDKNYFTETRDREYKITLSVTTEQADDIKLFPSLVTRNRLWLQKYLSWWVSSFLFLWTFLGIFFLQHQNCIK